MDTFDLPWLDEAEDHSQEFRLGQEIDLSSSGRDLLEYKAKPDTRLDDPGVILFVNPDRTRLLLVFLIAETPTGGVSKNALHDALDQIAWLRGLEPRRKQAPSRDAVFVGGENNGGLGTIRILGPSFSSSVPSIYNTLQEWCDNPSLKPSNQIIQLVSGTATALNSKPFTKELGLLPFDPSCLILSVETLLVNDHKRFQWVFNDIDRGVSNIDPEPRVSPTVILEPCGSPTVTPASRPSQPIVLLSEETGYGAYVSKLPLKKENVIRNALSFAYLGHSVRLLC